MSSKAPRIPKSTWNGYRDEITALYTAPDGTLAKVMEAMKEKYGFQPTENQYTTKFTRWGLRKYAKGGQWLYVDQKLRKRDLKGKKTAISIHGRKRSRSEAEKEIARNVTFTSRLQHTEDIPTPEGVQVFTPSADESSDTVTHQEEAFSNLPLLRLGKDLQMLIVRPDDFGMPPQLAAVQIFLQSFICLTCNDALDDSHIFNAVNWVLERFKRSLFTYIFELHTTTSRIFMRKIFPAFVKTGNTELVEEILDRRLTFNKQCNDGLPWSTDRLQEDCIAIAIQNQDQRMLKLLCRAGFRPRFRLGDERDALLSRMNLPWNTNNLEILLTLISFNADPDCMLTDVKRGFPLVNAAESGNLGAVDMLLKAGSSVNIYVEDYFGNSLQAAVHAEQLLMVKFLIEKGANVNAPYAEQYKLENMDWASAYQLKANMRKRHHCVAKTPIQIACELNNIPMVELLLDHGALVNLSPLSRLTAEALDTKSSSDHSIGYSPNYENIPYHTALQYSVQNRNLFLVRRLLSEGADPDSRVTSYWGDTPLQMAARLDYPEIVSILMENGADVNAPPGNIDGRTALQAAAESGNIATVSLFLRRNADVNSPAGYVRGLTALQAAAESGSGLILCLLLDRNADVNAPAGHKRGLTALQAALMHGHSDIAELLLRNNANIHAAPSPHYGLTTIETAISGRNLPMLKILMENGPEERDSTSAICAAAKYGWVEGVRYLLQHGNGVNSVCYDRFKSKFWKVYISPLAWSINNQDLEMMNLLLESGASLELPMITYPNDALCFALDQRCSPQIILLLCHQMGADLNTKMESKGPTGLQRAIHFGQIKLAKYLLEEGAEIQVPATEFEGTPLQEAILKGELELAYTLLERGADVDAPGNKFTALQAAAQTGNINIAVQLLRRGAHVAAEAVGEHGMTAINAAAKYGREGMLQLLLDHYDGNEDLRHVCQDAAIHAKRAGHPEIAEWLQGYAVPRL
ncbi:hypothetical protein ZTR_07259 [Talaromyces verruculosus]|nr:hypothetical protein ZTR_07259 [Talaromyces verruculosus]